MDHANPVVAGGLLRDAALMLGVALVFVTAFRRVGLGATLGYIVAGSLIGPSVLGFFRDPESVQRVSEVGISLLLFIVGLELQPSRLWRLRKDIFGLGLAQVVLCGVALSALLYLALGLSPEASLAIGLPLALSSTHHALPMLADYIQARPQDGGWQSSRSSRSAGGSCSEGSSSIPCSAYLAGLASASCSSSRACSRSLGRLH